MLKVLFVSRIPYPLDGGANIRTFNLIKNASDLCELTLLTPIFSKEEEKLISVLRPFFSNIVPVSVTIRRPVCKYWNAVRNMLFSSAPYITSAYVNLQFAERLMRTVKEVKFDVVHCDSIALSEAVIGIKCSRRVPIVLNEHNVESIILKRYVGNERNPIKRAYYRSQYKRLRRHEARICRAYDRVIAVSDVDRKIMEIEFNVGNVRVVENGVDTEYFKRAGSGYRDPYNLVFCGAMDWRPNVDAVDYFLSHCYGEIKRRIPQATLTIVGRNPPGRLRKLAAGINGVSITGTVDDVRPYVSKCSVFVVPLRIGGGSRLKILEAMSMEKAVVSTAVGAEGLEVIDDVHIVLADGARELAEKCVKVLLDEQKQFELGRNGRRLVLASYDWKRISAKMVEAWESIVG